MIGSLRGTLLERNQQRVLVDVSGVGYEVNVSAPTSVSLGELGAQVMLHIHTRVREDAITLFGFASAEERRCFDALIGAHGVGPTVALALLTAYSPIDLRHIIAAEDVDSLSKVPGIGKKTAARVLVELKSKFEVDFDNELVDISHTAVPSGGSTVRSDVTAALQGLGYGTDEIRTALSGLPAEGSATELLRLALRELAVAS